MKIIVTSDSHNQMMRIRDVIIKHYDADVVIFCGDGYKDIDEIRLLFNDKMIVSVRGNCDLGCDFRDSLEMTFAGKRFFITHGHIYNVKQGYNYIKQYGKNANSDIVLFGHTHIPYLSAEDNNMILLNPGSIGYSGTYGIIEIDDNTGKVTATLYPSGNTIDVSKKSR